ncbi:hypothetical protein [Clostridium vincentii]|nr:hypothetical protein [Clostridium vincentii]
MTTCGLLFIIISLILGFLNNFEGDQGALTFVVGVGLLTVGICFTPKLWKWIYRIVDMVVMFFSRSK